MPEASMDLGNRDQTTSAPSRQAIAHMRAPDLRGTLLGIVGLALLGAGLVLAATRIGAGTSPDSVVYIGVARNLLAGRGLTEPFGAEVDTALTRFPPLYSWLLAAGGPVGVDPLAMARWLAALLFGANILFVGLALVALLPQSRWLPLVGSLLLLTGLPLLTMHSMAWSEPLFLLLSFLGLFLLAESLGSGKAMTFALAGVLTGLAFLTRYAAIPFLAAGVLGLALWSRQSWARRLSSMVVFASLGALPSLLWAIRNLAVADTATARVLAWHPAGQAHVWQALYTVAGWLHVPQRAPDWLRLGLLLAAAAAALVVIVILWHGRPGRSVPPFIKLLALLIPLYAAFLVVSISLLDASTPLDDRILAPIYVTTIFLGLYAVSELLQVVGNPRHWQAALAALLLLVVGGSVIRGAGWVNDGYLNGIGFSSLAWQRSAFIQQVQSLPQETLTYSNAPEAIYLHAGRRAMPFPKPINVTTQQANLAYAAEVERMQELLSQQAAFVVYARSLSQRTSPTETELSQQLSLRILAQAVDGAIYASSISP
jgi:4-amino-4-deoxy-L-arabinose transferase-like glycosyltransferase